MNEQLVLKDEVHGNITLQGVYKELVESQDFQRLKDIVQTGTSYLKYPAMKEETRFDHSIGSYCNMCKMIQNIEAKLAMQGIKIEEEEKEIAKIATLLHDIGHGAYSHTLEKMTGYSHEKRSIAIVKDNSTQIHQILTKFYGEKFTNKVGEFLEGVYEHKKQNKPISDVAIKNGTIHLETLLASLISNNIDADRLDYLVRDSKRAGYKVLTEVEKLIESFEFVLDIDKIIVAIPEEKKILVDMAILERARNYRDIYFCGPSIIGDHVFEFLLQELQQHPEEVPADIAPVLQRFLTNSKANFTTQEYLTITETPLRQALEKIASKTKKERLKQLCDIEKMTKTYQVLNTDKKEGYIRYLLHKAIPEIPENTKGLIVEERKVKPYKSNENENIHVITRNGIEDYQDTKQDLINLEPFSKKVTAMSLEMLRLELGISQQELEQKYKKTIEEVISTVTKAKDEFELRYVITKGSLQGETIKEMIEKQYEIIDHAFYMSNDIYYDNPETYALLENKQAFRIRRGTTFHKKEETYQFKEKRATYKTYQKGQQSNFTIRRKEEEIGDTEKIEDYKEFVSAMQLDIKKLKPVLEVSNMRRLYTICSNGILLDISFNMAYYINRIYEMFGNIGTIEIRPRENRVLDRLGLLELREYLEKQFPQLAQFLSNTNVYEIGMLDTYEKYQKGYIINQDAKKYEEEHAESTKKLKELLKKAKETKDFAWLRNIPSVEENLL